MKLCLLLIGTFVFLGTAVAQGATARATVNSIDAKGVGTAIGSVTFRDTKWGLLITPDLSRLVPGVHGFHVHEKAVCGTAEHEGKLSAGLAAGGHYEPHHTSKHLGPYSTEGHEGDLPTLIVNADGTATLPVVAPRLAVQDIVGHSVIIHAGADNYSDAPAPLGGGGDRVACGVIQ